ncbi:hypothetical protein NQ176_g57 [Zarea fungicola]|uniref:Uncharacterized protein n=1 Tax=Zarea fungicola TaxID=93591 RepID=A0ACC1NZG0_9HYPO|nr:hypothetical protein NQ176_g57 [Lecanicillium fungicola]
MQLNYAALIAAFHCIPAVAVPTASPAIVARDDFKFDDFPLCPNGIESLRTQEELDAYFEQFGAVWSPPANLEARSDTRGLYRGKLYRISQWVFYCGQVLVEQFGGTTPPRLAFPRDAPGMQKLSDAITDSVLATIGNGRVTKNVGDWTWAGNIFQSAYEYNEIPRPVMFTIVLEGIIAATDWITDDNAFDVIIHDEGGHALMQFSLFPKHKGDILRFYDE